MTQRRRLDQHLVEQAIAAGVEFRDGSAVGDVELREEAVEASVDGTRVGAAFLVGADGANGAVARAIGVDAGIVRGVALEGNVSWDELGREPYEETAWVELGVVPGGYGWVFPKGDHANLGVGGWMSEGPKLRAHLDRLAREHRVDPARLESVRGHRLPMRKLGTPAARGPVLLVGDAAGLVDPLSGDGMYEAFVSAKLAAEAILAARPETYEDDARGSPRPPRRLVVEGEGRGRSLPPRVRVGAPRAGRLRRRRRALARRPRAPGRGARPGPAAAPRPVAARAAREPFPLTSRMGA